MRLDTLYQTENLSTELLLVDPTTKSCSNKQIMMESLHCQMKAGFQYFFKKTVKQKTPT